jgi:small subunit ribosomal protein S20
LCMANIKSQMKRNRQNDVRRLRNKAVRSELKTRIKRFEEALASGDREETSAALHAAVSKLDKAAAKGIIHRNKAANHKSALMRRATA